YNIGGTAPIGMPNTIRKLNKYTFKTNISFGLDVQKDLWGRWGLLTGLHIENKAMDIDATVKNYHMEMVKGGESLEGMYTGRLVTQCEEWMLTLPIMATLRTGNVLLKAGPYISYLGTGTFEGYVYDGYLREGNPTGAKIEMGNTDGSRGTYDFSDHMRHWQFGIDIGADWQLSKRWGIYGDITWGLTGVHESSFKTIEQTLYPIFGTVGITYKLK
ncbi:MAG: porin family protein, partial [Prevotella sp.]|nr:porin family protein [Prevotella sp.]